MATTKLGEPRPPSARPADPTTTASEPSDRVADPSYAAPLLSREEATAIAAGLRARAPGA